ncbi:MAG: hypothetical protein JWM32_108 [Verrucomicrobia bacterium]|nr:hypothetical protein [Verrucomicrobiota bacterium]
MKSPRLYPSFLIAAAVTLLLITAARADESEAASIKFSDPSKPGTLKVGIANGDLCIRGTDAAEVTVTTDLKPESSALRKDGLRVLTSSSSYSLTEKNNVVQLTHGLDGWGAGGGGSDFTITVPRNTSVVINSNYGGDIEVENISGNIEIRTLNGEVVLRDITSAALVESTNGGINATVRELADGKPLSFLSINGEVALNLPATAKANIRLRTHNGSILTDFDEKSLVTKTESIRVNAHARTPRAVVIGRNSDTDVAVAVHEAVRAGAEAAQEVAAAVRESAIAARNAARDAERQARAAARASRDDDDNDAVAPLAPMAPLPPMTGGKIVTGTLNGGGAEIRVTTMNGDVTLRKLDERK